jgi:hypothetical protein
MMMSCPATPRTKHKKLSACINHSGGKVAGLGIANNVNTSTTTNTTATRKGASMVGLGLADLNQQLCNAMFGVVLGERQPTSMTPKVN